MRIIQFLGILIIALSFSCNKKAAVYVAPNSEALVYSGRVELSDSTVSNLHWPGSSIKIRFKGTSIKAELADQKGDNYYNIIIDDDSVVMLNLDAERKWYVIADKLSDKEHTVELFRRTEIEHGSTSFYGFKLDEEAHLLPIQEIKQRNIEFYGNSITSGYAVEDTAGLDRPDSIYTNNYRSYAAITARNLNANYTCISKGGIGITVSWFPYVMSDIYDKLNPFDSTSLWDFNTNVPDLVVINLCQNDSWIVNRPDYPTFEKYFGKEKPTKEFLIKAYAEFVQLIRAKYADAHIICMLGNMDIIQKGSPWPGYVESAVSSLNDEKVRVYIVPYKDTPGHPNVFEQQFMAESLSRFIEDNISW